MKFRVSHKRLRPQDNMFLKFHLQFQVLFSTLVCNFLGFVWSLYLWSLEPNGWSGRGAREVAPAVATRSALVGNLGGEMRVHSSAGRQAHSVYSLGTR